MSTEAHAWLRLVVLVLVVLFASPSGLAAEEGQYRSRILVTPPGEIGIGSGVSNRELEQQIDRIDDPYARSGAARHLGRHFAGEGDYVKAERYYRDALETAGLADVANREILRELARIYLQQGNYDAAANAIEQALAMNLAPDAMDFLVLAQTHYKLRQYVKAVEALDRLTALDVTLERSQMEQVVAVYYRASGYRQAETYLRQLIERYPDAHRHWHLLANVYLQMGKRRQALNQLVLARQKGIPFEQSDLVLLADLHAANGDPYEGAQFLQTSMAAGLVEPSGNHYRKLFEYWFQAREKQRAMDSLDKAAALTGDIELYMYLAQLLQEDAKWQGMYEAMLRACEKPLPEKYLGRANLLLGVSQLKLGNPEGARRSFINATLIGGATEQAAQWLNFMAAAPPTEDELRRLKGICYGAEDVQLKVARHSGRGESSTKLDVELLELLRKTVPAMRFFSASYTEPLDEAMGKLRQRLARMNIALIKSGGKATGTAQVIFTLDSSTASTIEQWDLAIPTGGTTRGAGRHRAHSVGAFNCVYFRYEGEPEGFLKTLNQFLARVEEENFALGGEVRLVFLPDFSSKGLLIEVQVGVE